MNEKDWKTAFRAVYDSAVVAWKDGRRSPGAMFSAQDAAFLKSIGCNPRELFDFVDDAQAWGEPDFDSVQEVQSIRREYFLEIQKGQSSGRIASMDELAPKSAAVDGIEWLPRIIQKARLKLRGEMPDDLMYGCGGDRPFLKRVNRTLPDFLMLVRDSGDDDRKIIDAVKKSADIR